MSRTDIDERFWSKVTKKATHECWEFSPVAEDGYGYFTIEKHYTRGAHRVAYLLTYGWNSLDGGLEAHHKCYNKACVNPNHLEPKTRSENLRDIYKEKCRNGHIRTKENTGFRPNGKRRCRDCENARQRERYWDSEAMKINNLKDRK